MVHERGLRIVGNGGQPAADDGASLRSAAHPYTISGFDAWGNRISETIEVELSWPRRPLLSFLMRHTPWFAWNVWYRLGFTRIRMITKIAPSACSIETTEIEIKNDGALTESGAAPTKTPS